MIYDLLAVSLIIQLVMFGFAYRFKTDKLTDISYALTFALLAAVSYFRNDFALAKLILLLMVFAWALRLGAYLFIRINKIGRDKRFDEMRENFFRFLSFWVLQGVTVFVVLLPVFYFFTSAVEIGPLVYLGGFVWFVGLIVEGFADQQKFEFKNDRENKGKWVNVGLWKYSRHPNYLGEIMVWVGVYLYAYSSLGATERLVSLAGPLLIIILLLFVSGIPKLEEKYDKRWADNKDYKKYKENTALLIPYIY